MKRNNLLILLPSSIFFLLPALLFAQMEWICVTDSAGWPEREGHTSVVFDNKIWVIGGWDEGSWKNDVWYSTNGVNWTQATDSAGWSERDRHTLIVFDFKIWVLGGGAYFPIYYNDVWFSYGLGIGEEHTNLDAERLIPEIYPNPAKTVLRVRVPLFVKGATAIKIFDVSGKTVKVLNVTSAQKHKDEVRISLKGINPGIYFLQLGSTVRKFLVVR